VFPLFIENDFKKKEIQLLKDDLTKISFNEVVKEVVKKGSKNVFDFYLITYNRDMGFLNFDYISGFEFYKNGKSVFEIEQLLNQMFFDYKLQNNYFSTKVDSKNANLDNAIYRYRTQIFDFVYRAKDSLNHDDISEMYIQTLQRKLRDCYDKEKEGLAISTINKLKTHFLELNKTFGGNLMQTVERIKESGKVTDLESLSYYLGQIVKILLNKSKTDNKTHTLVEPFINITNFKILGLKLQETFNSYKHSVYLNDSSFNQKMSEIFSFLYDNQDKEFNRELKILFYAGYFDESTVYENKK
jgi:CRISPR-associated protein Csh1